MKEILLNKVLFSLPCKSFLIDYSTTQNRVLPIVKEYILRFLYLLEACKPQKISDFFGFSDIELQIIISDLIEEQLVEWKNENVSLTEYAKSNFHEVQGQMTPQFFQTEDKIDSASFELNSYKILNSVLKETPRSPLGIDIPIDDEAYKFTNEKAKSSFDKNFNQFLEEVKNVDIFSEKIDLYRVNHVTAKNDSILPIEIEYYINNNNPYNIRSKYTINEITKWDSQNTLMTAIDRAVACDDIEVQFFDNNDIRAHINFTRDPFLSNFLIKQDEIDLNSLLNDNQKLNNIKASLESSRFIIGNLYTEKNIEKIRDTINEHYKKNNRFFVNSILWIQNQIENVSWGRHKNFIELISYLNKRFDSKKNDGKVSLIFPSNRQNFYFFKELYSSNIPRFFTDFDVYLQGLNRKIGSNNTELLLIPGKMLVSLYHYKPNKNQNLSIPIGYITTDLQVIREVTDNINNWFGDKLNYNDYFEKQNVKEEDKIINKRIKKSLSKVID